MGSLVPGFVRAASSGFDDLNRSPLIHPTMKFEHHRIDAVDYHEAERAILRAIGLSSEVDLARGFLSHPLHDATLRTTLQTLLQKGRVEALRMEARLNQRAFVYRFANRLYVIVPSEVPHAEDEYLCLTLGRILSSWWTSVKLLTIQKQPHATPFGRVSSDKTHPFAHAILTVLVVTEPSVKDEL